MIFSTSVAAFLMGCGSKDESVHNIDIPSSIKLSATERAVAVDLLIPSKIFIHKGKLIVFEQTTTNMFKVFDLETFKHLYSYGNVGRADFEFASSVGNSDIIPSEDIEIYGLGKLKYVEFRDTSASIVRSNLLPLRTMAAPVNRLNKINDSLYYFDNIFDPKDQNEFVKLNVKTKEQSTFSPYPDWISERISDADMYRVYMKSSLYNPYQDKIAAFYYSFPKMKVINASSGKVISETHINNVSDDAKEGKIFFTEPFATNNYVYVMWVNTSKREASAENSKFRPSIFVFDWEGNLVANYELDQPVITFTISEKHNKLYCTSFTKPNVILEYDLPHLSNGSEGVFIENKFYTIELPTGSRHSDDRKGFDKIMNKNGYRTNVNYFVQQRDEKGNKIYDFTSMQIGLYEPLDSITPAYPYFKPKNEDVIRQGTFPINDKQAEYFYSKQNLPDYDKKIHLLYSLECIFTVGGTEVSINMCFDKDINNLGKYISMQQLMAESFTLKMDLNTVDSGIPEQ